MYCDACCVDIDTSNSRLVYIKQDNDDHRLVILCDECYKEYDELNLIEHNLSRRYLNG